MIHRPDIAESFSRSPYLIATAKLQISNHFFVSKRPRNAHHSTFDGKIDGEFTTIAGFPSTCSTIQLSLRSSPSGVWEGRVILRKVAVPHVAGAISLGYTILYGSYMRTVQIMWVKQ